MVHQIQELLIRFMSFNSFEQGSADYSHYAKASPTACFYTAHKVRMI